MADVTDIQLRDGSAMDNVYSIELNPSPKGNSTWCSGLVASTQDIVTEDPPLRWPHIRHGVPPLGVESDSAARRRCRRVRPGLFSAWFVQCRVRFWAWFGSGPGRAGLVFALGRKLAKPATRAGFCLVLTAGGHRWTCGLPTWGTLVPLRFGLWPPRIRGDRSAERESREPGAIFPTVVGDDYYLQKR